MLDSVTKHHDEVRLIQPTWHCLLRFRQRVKIEPGTDAAVHALRESLVRAHLTRMPPGWVASRDRAEARRAMRVVVIGAGPNGLVCAAHLAATGVEVTVLDQADRGFWGGISSADGPLPGFRHDICAGFFPLTRASPAFRSLGLDEVEWIDPPTVMAHPFRDGTALALERDIGATAAGLGSAGPRYERFIARL